MATAKPAFMAGDAVTAGDWLNGEEVTGVHFSRYEDAPSLLNSWDITTKLM